MQMHDYKNLIEIEIDFFSGTYYKKYFYMLLYQYS